MAIIAFAPPGEDPQAAVLPGATGALARQPWRAAAQAEAAALADEEVSTYLADPALRHLLGDAEWHAGLEARVTDRDRKNELLQEARDALTGAVVRVSADEVEHDAELLSAAVRGSVDHVLVKRGRGLAIADRVEVI